MPVTTIPLIGTPSQRGPISSAALTAGQDRRFINTNFVGIVDNAKQTKEIYVEKRQGMESFSTPSSGNPGVAIFVSPSTANVITVFGIAAVPHIYSGTTDCGIITSNPNGVISEAVFSGITYYLIGNNSGGWFLASDAIGGFTFTGDTHTNTTIDGVSSLTGLYVGQLISGTGIAAGTRIATITAPSTITTTLATTATNAGITITREGVAKIIDADFPTSCVGLVEMDGYIFTASGTKIYNSALNSVTSWDASHFITANISTDNINSIVKIKNRIVVMSSDSIEFFFNAGNSAGSPLSSDKSSVILTGGASNYSQNNNYLFFIGTIQTTPGVYSFRDAQLNKISTPPIDRAVSSAGFLTALSSFVYGGYTNVLCSRPNTTSCFKYCLELDIWDEQNLPSQTTIASNGPYFVNAGTTGKVFYFSKTPVYQDNGSAFTMTIQTEPKVLNKGRGFKINSIELLADTPSSGSTTLEISRDDYGSFQTLGSFPLTSNRKRITRGGYCRHHAIFRISDSGNQAWRGQALVVDWEPCAT